MSVCNAELYQQVVERLKYIRGKDVRLSQGLLFERVVCCIQHGHRLPDGVVRVQLDKSSRYQIAFDRVMIGTPTDCLPIQLVMQAVVSPMVHGAPRVSLGIVHVQVCDSSAPSFVKDITINGDLDEMSLIDSLCTAVAGPVANFTSSSGRANDARLFLRNSSNESSLSTNSSGLYDDDNQSCFERQQTNRGHRGAKRKLCVRVQHVIAYECIERGWDILQSSLRIAAGNRRAIEKSIQLLLSDLLTSKKPNGEFDAALGISYIACRSVLPLVPLQEVYSRIGIEAPSGTLAKRMDMLCGTLDREICTWLRKQLLQVTTVVDRHWSDCLLNTALSVK